MSIVKSNFNNNYARLSGGAIYFSGNKDINITDVIFTNNKALV